MYQKEMIIVCVLWGEEGKRKVSADMRWGTLKKANSQTPTVHRKATNRWRTEVMSAVEEDSWPHGAWNWNNDRWRFEALRQPPVAPTLIPPTGAVDSAPHKPP